MMARVGEECTAKTYVTAGTPIDQRLARETGLMRSAVLRRRQASDSGGTVYVKHGTPLKSFVGVIALTMAV
jgi:hypothetical protein